MAEVAENTIVDGRYRITSRIGTGGMADVYCAHDEHLGRDVAIKLLHRRFAQDQEFVERFRREASAAAGLQHPNVVGVFDRGEYDGTYYIAMEYLPGRTLKDVIREESPIDQLRAIDYAIQILQAASFAVPGKIFQTEKMQQPRRAEARQYRGDAHIIRNYFIQQVVAHGGKHTPREIVRAFMLAANDH